LGRAGVLQGVVIVGSWCVLFYAKYFGSDDYTPTIRTRDLDLAIPIPAHFGKTVDLAQITDQLGFVTDFRGHDGYMRFMHPDLILEFLVPERGRPSTKPYEIEALGINAQPLRYLDLLLDETIVLPFGDVNLRVPHPVRFALHKLIISARRKSDKGDRDRAQAVMVLEAVWSAGEQHRIADVYSALPAKWRRSIDAVLRNMGETGLVHAE